VLIAGARKGLGQMSGQGDDRAILDENSSIGSEAGGNRGEGLALGPEKEQQDSFEQGAALALKPLVNSDFGKERSAD